MKFSSILGLIGLYHKNWVLTFFLYPKYWHWGYKYVEPEKFPYWTYRSFGLGPLFSLYISYTNWEEWFKLK